MKINFSIPDAEATEIVYWQGIGKIQLQTALRKVFALASDQHQFVALYRGENKSPSILRFDDCWKLGWILYPPQVPNELAEKAARLREYLSKFTLADFEQHFYLRALAGLHHQLIHSAGL